MTPLKFSESGLPEVNPETMQSSLPNVFCVGDLAGISETTVESVNDGKTAAWFMHRYLQVSSVRCPVFISTKLVTSHKMYSNTVP
jgi:dihydropyrimidine dehydrogenase (NADP+)